MRYTVAPGLKNYKVIDIAFGDWHYLALTDTGRALSWGTNASHRRLGLGTPNVAATKGVRYARNHNGILEMAQKVKGDDSPPGGRV